MRHYAPIVLAALAFAASACGGGNDDDDDRAQPPGATDLVQPPRQIDALAKRGEPEGRLRLVAFPGYVEAGRADRDVDWVTPFERRTGCRVVADYAETSEQMVEMLRTGRYDGASVTGDATLRLIAGGDVAPLNTDLLTNYGDVFEGLKNLPHNSLGDRMYGVPQGRGANVLMWNEGAVDPPPDSWSVVFDQDSPQRGKVLAYQSPIYIADAALYLKATRPELKITSPYALDDKQFTAAVDLLKQQRKIVRGYWGDYTEAEEAFNRRDVTVGVGWQAIANLVDGGGKVNVGATIPKEGATGWSDTWMIASDAEHPNCMYAWMDHVLSPEVNAQIAEYFGQAPSNRRACDATSDPGHCATFHATDERYWERVAYWTTPTTSCGDERGPNCKDYADWVAAWADVVR